MFSEDAKYATQSLPTFSAKIFVLAACGCARLPRHLAASRKVAESVNLERRLSDLVNEVYGLTSEEVGCSGLRHRLTCPSSKTEASVLRFTPGTPGKVMTTGGTGGKSRVCEAYRSTGRTKAPPHSTSARSLSPGLPTS